MCCSTVTAVKIFALLNSSPQLTTLPAADHKQDTRACEDDLPLKWGACAQGRQQAEHLDQSWTLPWQLNMQSRDFTVNALMYDPFTHLLFDYVGGMQDCQKRLLRCIKEPAQSFTEDLARMLRAVRLSAQTGKTHAMSLWCEHCYITSHVLSAIMSLSS